MAAKAPSLAAQITQRSTAARLQAAREWRELARVALTGDAPDLAAVEDLGAALGLPRSESADAFQHDVEALRNHAIHTATADALAAQAVVDLAEFATDEALAAAITATENRLGELRRLEVALHYARVGSGEAATRARRLAELHPRVLGGEGGR